MRSVACWVKSFSEEPRVPCAGGEYLCSKKVENTRNF